MKSRFPIGLTISTAIAFAILCGLGVWQLKRLAWKQDLLAKIEALKTAPAAPIGPVLERAKAGEDVAWTRVSVRCDHFGQPDPTDWPRYSLRDGQIAWRAVTTCRLGEGPYRLIYVDRGFIEASVGKVSPPTATFPPLESAKGVLVSLPGNSKRSGVGSMPVVMRSDGGRKPQFWIRGTTAAPLLLMVEAETPPPPGVTPSAVPPDIPNRHLEYALTWFGLAGALAAVYAALLRRRLKA